MYKTCTRPWAKVFSFDGRGRVRVCQFRPRPRTQISFQLARNLLSSGLAASTQRSPPSQIIDLHCGPSPRGPHRSGVVATCGPTTSVLALPDESKVDLKKLNSANAKMGRLWNLISDVVDPGTRGCQTLAILPPAREMQRTRPFKETAWSSIRRTQCRVSRAGIHGQSQNRGVVKSVRAASPLGDFPGEVLTDSFGVNWSWQRREAAYNSLFAKFLSLRI